MNFWRFRHRNWPGFLFPFIAGCFIFSASPAQEYSYVHYDTRDGLAGSVVYCMAQDLDGFMWFGTETGLSRFDGKHFKNFSTEEGLPDNEIIKLFVDSKNRVWIMPFKESLCYYQKGKFHSSENDSLLKSLSIRSEVVSIVENRKGDIAILETYKLTLLKASGEVTVIKQVFDPDFAWGIKAGLLNDTVFNVSISSHHTGNRVYRVEQDSLVYLRKLDKLFTNGSAYLHLSPELNVYVTGADVNFILPGSGKKFSIPGPDGFISINQLNDSLVSINASSVVHTYNFLQQKPGQFFFTDKKISAVLEDAEGGYWFSSMGEGVYRLISGVVKNYFFKNGNTVQAIYDIKKYGDTLLAGSDNYRIWLVNTTTGETGKLEIKGEQSLGRVVAIGKKNNYLFLGTDKGLLKCWKNKTLVSSGTFAVKSMWLYEDRIVLATNNGVFRYYQYDLQDFDILWHGRVTSIYRQDNLIYFGTLTGLYICNPGNNDRIEYVGAQLSVLKNRISFIAGNPSDGMIWIATYGGGLIGYKNGKIIYRLTTKDGLSSNICRTIYASGNIVWVGTDKGLNKLRYTDGNIVITRYTMADGLNSNIINAIISDNNIIYVATPAGITFFDETRISNNSICKLYITGIQTPHHRWEYDTTGLRFAHTENNIRIEYAGISFKSAGDITYRYRLLGLDETWQTTQDNFLTYPTLPSGDYVLQVVATNKFGVESEMANVSFTIKKLFWEKNWVRLTGLVLLGTIIWIFVQYRIRQIREQEAIKNNTVKKISELEQMALKAQMNPHFIFNSLNSIQQYVIDKDIQGANTFITGFSRLIRQTLDLSSRNSISVEEEINYISTYLSLEQAKFEGIFTYRIHVDEQLKITACQIPPMILQPYIENSIRHGIRYRQDKKGHIGINFRQKNDYLECVIEDNGIGRKAARQYKGSMPIEYQSKGMSLTANRVEMMNRVSKQPIGICVEDLNDESGKALGTKVTLQFPINLTA